MATTRGIKFSCLSSFSAYVLHYLSIRIGTDYDIDSPKDVSRRAPRVGTTSSMLDLPAAISGKCCGRPSVAECPGSSYMESSAHQTHMPWYRDLPVDTVFQQGDLLRVRKIEDYDTPYCPNIETPCYARGCNHGNPSNTMERVKIG